MQADAYQEFLQANSRRNYPFVEDASLWDDGMAYEIPLELFQGFRGMTRQQPEDPQVPVQLAAIVGPDAPSLPGPFQVESSGWSFVFRLGTLNQLSGEPQYLRILIDDANMDPSNAVAFAPSAFGQDLPVGGNSDFGLNRTPSSDIYSSDDFDYLAAMIQVTLTSEDALALMPAVKTDRYYFSDARIEPALMTNMWRTEIERLVVEDQCWPEADVKGEVVIKEGYNMEVVRLGNSIQLAPARRAGQGVQSIIEFEAWLCDGSSSSSSSESMSSGSLSPEEVRIQQLREPCRNNILRVNGIGPDLGYNFKIIGGNGVTVRNFPSDHLIVVSFNIPQPTQICPDEE